MARGEDEKVFDGFLHRVEPASATLEAPLELSDVGHPYFAMESLSPSGRYWLRQPRSRQEPARLLDLVTEEVTELDARRLTWMVNDTPAWVTRSGDGRHELFVGWPGQERRIRELSGNWFWLDASPDAEKLLVMILLPGEPRRYRYAVYELATDRWVESDTTGDSWESVQWAGPEALALVEQGALSLLDPETGVAEVVIGRPRR
jgi:hypothetical protein